MENQNCNTFLFGGEKRKGMKGLGAFDEIKIHKGIWSNRILCTTPLKIVKC